MKNNNRHIIFVMLGILSLGIIMAVMQSFKQSDNLVVYATTFEECVANGNPIMESYPRQCAAANGTVFVEVIESPAVDQNIADEFNPVFDDQNETAAENQMQNKPTECIVAGCSSQLCVSAENEGQLSTCEFLPQYACYRTATCEVQPTGECGWTQTEQLQQCINNSPSF